MPIVNVQLLEGRPLEVKERLIAELTRTVAEVLGSPPPAIRVLLTEVPPAHWGVGGVSKQKESEQP
jgi:4-oxalocrotonate tautomerase